jgi:intracellular multiplication protein IcmL
MAKDYLGKDVSFNKRVKEIKSNMEKEEKFLEKREEELTEAITIASGNEKQEEFTTYAVSFEKEEAEEVKEAEEAKEALLMRVTPSGAEYVIGSRDFYISQNRKLFTVIKYLLPILVIFLVLFTYFVLREEGRVRYFAVTPDLRVMEMSSLTEPYISSEGLIDWTGEVVCGALSLDFLHWKKKLMDLRSNFDPKGFQSFLESLETGGHIKKIQEERLSLSTVMTDAPVIVSQGLYGGRMTWKIEMPLIISYQSSTGISATQKLLGEILVQRVPPSQNPKGVVIRQVVLSKL